MYMYSLGSTKHFIRAEDPFYFPGFLKVLCIIDLKYSCDVRPGLLTYIMLSHVYIYTHWELNIVLLLFVQEVVIRFI